MSEQKGQTNIKKYDIEKEKKTLNVMGIIGLILSIAVFISLICFNTSLQESIFVTMLMLLLWILSLIFNIIALVYGSNIKKQISKTQLGKVFGILGIIINAISLMMVLLFIYIIVSFTGDVLNKLGINVSERKKENLILQASNTLDDVSKLEDNKIYKLNYLVSEGLITETSAFDKPFLSTSYVSKIGGEIEFCLIDKDNNGVVYSSRYDENKNETIYDKSKLEYTKLNRKCEFTISKIQAEKYLKQKLEEKYNTKLSVKECVNLSEGTDIWIKHVGIQCEFNNGLKANLYDSNFPDYEVIAK